MNYAAYAIQDQLAEAAEKEAALSKMSRDQVLALTEAELDWHRAKSKRARDGKLLHKDCSRVGIEDAVGDGDGFRRIALSSQCCRTKTQLPITCGTREL